MKHVTRHLALAAALLALGMLGWSSFRPLENPASPVEMVTLWTAGAAAAALTQPGTHLALPGAHQAPATAIHIPDTAFLRRAFPALQRIVVTGDGVEPAAAADLRDVTVSWHRPDAPVAASPEFTTLSAPRTLRVGQRFTVQGRVGGLPANAPVTLGLDGPDGAMQAAELRAGPDGTAVFSLTSGTAAVAPGAFEWKLRLGPNREPHPLGAVVTAPELPRVLLLQAAPEVEGGRLQRWLAEAGGRVTSRTRVSAEHVRVTAANGSPDAMTEFDATALADFDLVVASAGALAGLTNGERAALDQSVREDGLGLLTVGEPVDDAVAPFTPWKIRRNEANADRDDGRLSRLRLDDGTELAEPIIVAPAEIVSPPLLRRLVRDPQDRVLAAARPYGRGTTARSLIGVTWRWLQRGHPEVYARYWSNLLSAVARPSPGVEGRWTIGNETAPLFAGEPIRLVWHGASGEKLPDAVAGQSGERPTSLTLARDSREPSVAHAVYWPARSGWHRVRTAPRGPEFKFHVLPADALPGLRVERRRDATARLVNERVAAAITAPTDHHPGQSRRFHDFVWFGLFVVSTGWLWWEHRRPQSFERFRGAKT